MNVYTCARARGKFRVACTKKKNGTVLYILRGAAEVFYQENIFPDNDGGKSIFFA